MCLLSVYSPGSLVNVDHLEAGAYCNPDGFGFAIIVGDRIETAHGMDANAVIMAFDRVRAAHPESWAMFHSRLTTDGLTDEANCHPFAVGGDARTVLGHNGILPNEARPGAKDVRSDTRILSEVLIPGGRFGPLHRARSRRNLARWMVKDGYPNKVAILTVDPRFKEPAYILNEKAGTWESGVWHSNDAYLQYIPSPLDAYASSDAWSRYLNGEISYTQYVEEKYQELLSPPRLLTCHVCLVPDNVDQQFRFCWECDICLDCYERSNHCQCYTPALTKKNPL